MIFEKLDIGAEKLDIGVEKLDIQGLPKPTQKNIRAVFTATVGLEFFKRANIETILSISKTAMSNLLDTMLQHGLIESVSGHGKGAYRWRK